MTPATETTRPQFDAQLDALRSDLLAMGFQTEEMLRDAIDALTASVAGVSGAMGSGRSAEAVAADLLRRDDQVDQAEARIESAGVHVLSIYQPVLPADLRLILTVLKAAGNVERIGDHAVNIVKIVRRMERDGVLYRPLVDVGKLGDRTRQMLHDALEAIVHHDAALAQAVIDADAAVDKLYSRMRKDLQATMESDPAAVRVASSLLFVIHYLERVSDRATNIAEQYLYLDTGRQQPVGRRSGQKKSKSLPPSET